MKAGPIIDIETENDHPLKHMSITKESIHRALLQPQHSQVGGNGKERAGEKEGIDRVITAVLRRWNVSEKFVWSL